MEEWRSMPAAELGRAIGDGRIDPRELVRAFLDAIDASPEAPRIYARITRERALAEADAAAERASRGLRRSPLDGVPVSWKDLFDTAGVGTEAGSALLAGRVPDRDAEVLRNATSLGLVCLGKTHMSELAFSGLGLNPVTDTPPNVNYPRSAPGGSSSGAAASVAFGLAAAAVGSDTGGSVRIPAAWNDLVGLKTSHGRLSLEGVVPLCPGFDTVGPLTRTVEDAALMLGALDGARPPDIAGATMEGTRLGLLETLALDDLRDPPRAAFQSAAERLNAAGALVEPLALPQIEEAMSLTGILYTSEAYGVWKDIIEAAPERMFAPTLERFRAGADHSAADYVAAWRRLEQLRAEAAAALAGFDAIILPTSPILPPDADRLLADLDFYAAENLLALRNTRIGNLMNLTALTLPAGVPSCGITLAAPAGHEERLLRLGAAAEAALA